MGNLEGLIRIDRIPRYELELFLKSSESIFSNYERVLESEPQILQDDSKNSEDYIIRCLYSFTTMILGQIQD